MDVLGIQVLIVDHNFFFFAMQIRNQEGERCSATSANMNNAQFQHNSNGTSACRDINTVLLLDAHYIWDGVCSGQSING